MDNNIPENKDDANTDNANEVYGENYSPIVLPDGPSLGERIEMLEHRVKFLENLVLKGQSETDDMLNKNEEDS